MSNYDVALTLDEAVAEVMGLLVDNDLELIPELDRYQSVTRALNRAMRDIALENEWSYYSSVENVGVAHHGDRTVVLRNAVRPRIINDDAVRLVHPVTGAVCVWAYWLPRDALHKYTGYDLKAAHTRSSIEFSRPFLEGEDGLEIHVPVMREPRMFRLPPRPEDPEAELPIVPEDVRNQEVDFDYPDLVVRRAAWAYAQTNPLWQTRVQTLEASYNDLKYALVERDQRNTDTPYQNEWTMGIEGAATGTRGRAHRPSSDSWNLI
ncbi:hypothetical protein SEA_ALOEVERA_45 [Microbacterium phage AloeVera]|uniref:Uncharacterized protein n=3 Tax=Akonivirus akoni TaxID=2845587 RepID=A0A6M3TB06_9CAUD|nr:hypothetical protein HWC17_gp44 [Microbacterium phage Akoni]QCG78330.1 hypothetical protein SEA_AKONI_44 [Microbacterium phage Akoni]QJD51294.1 hypothetical protein SEA_TRUONG_44 [Microbacterium phage Truong]QJD51784.1 hypothetical protein SEA_ASHTON_45 [Microbacterium phage Ashton]